MLENKYANHSQKLKGNGVLKIVSFYLSLFFLI